MVSCLQNRHRRYIYRKLVRNDVSLTEIRWSVSPIPVDYYCSQALHKRFIKMTNWFISMKKSPRHKHTKDQSAYKNEVWKEKSVKAATEIENCMDKSVNFCKSQ